MTHAVRIGIDATNVLVGGGVTHLIELLNAADPDRHDPRVPHEVGDLLFATVTVARLLHVDPELALRQASRRFERRVTAAAALAATEGADWTALDLPAQETYYQRAKATEAAAPSATDPEGPA